MPARTALPLSANFGLSDRSYWSSGLIYVSGVEHTDPVTGAGQRRLSPPHRRVFVCSKDSSVHS